MYIFEAQYCDLNADKIVTRTIELPEFGPEREMFVEAMMVAYDGASENEELVSLEFIAC